MKLSSLYSVNMQQVLNGLLLAVLGAVITVIENSLEAGNFIFNWTNIWHVALAAGVGYIAKKYFSDAPKTVEIDRTKTVVIDKDTQQRIA